MPYYHLPYVSYVPRLSEDELIYRPATRTVTRLVTYPEAPHHIVRVRVRPSVVLRELDRIAYRRRPNLAVSAVDDFFRSETTKAFEDESRRIRADTAALLTRARSVVPRGKTLAPIDTVYSSYYHSDPVPYPYSFSNDAYIAKLLVPLRSVADNIHNISFYSEPAKKFTGRGHLACVHYSGKKAFSNRLPLYKEMSIRDDVNLLSFYAKNRLAAAGLSVEKVAVKLLPWRPSRKFQAPQIMEDPALELKAAKADREARFRATTAEPVLAPAADLTEIKRKRQEEARAAEEKALKEEAKREADRKAQAEREAAEKKKAEEEARKAEEAKRKAEEEARKAEEEARLAEEAKKAEEARLAEEAKLAEEARLAEEAKKAEEAKLAEEARLLEEARLAEEAKLAEEERQAEQRRQEELARLEELEKQAQEEREAELARQAAELAEIARQESELAAARLEELSRSESAADNVVEAEASETPADEPEPIVEEPETPEAAPEVTAEADPEDDAEEVSEDERAEPDVTDEE